MEATLSMIARQAQDAEARSAAVARLTDINLDDLVASFGWHGRPVLAAVTRRLLGNAAETFARQIADFDAAVGSEGLVGAARRTVSNYVAEVRVFGRENIPAGPFLALSNHPGLSDALSLFAALDRPDLRIIALQRPFLQALPQVSRHLSCLSEAPSSHASAIRRIGTHLRGGGAALSFPAGRIEPDPDLGSGALASLASWARSADAFARLAPEAAILPVLVRGVVWPRAMRHWLVRFRREAGDRDKAAAALQILAHVMLKVRPVSVGVQIGRPVFGPRAPHAAVLAEMTTMIRNPPAGEGQRVA